MVKVIWWARFLGASPVEHTVLSNDVPPHTFLRTKYVLDQHWIFHKSVYISCTVSFAGFDPLVVFTKHESSNLGSLKPLPWDVSLSEILRREPFLVFSLLFLFLKVLFYSFPKMLACLKEFWVSQCWRPNVGITGETGQLLERVVHVIDMKGAWSRLRFCKNPRIWASSLTCLLGWIIFDAI